MESSSQSFKGLSLKPCHCVLKPLTARMAPNPSRKMFMWGEETSNRLFTGHRLKCFCLGAVRWPVRMCLPQLFPQTGDGDPGGIPVSPSNLSELGPWETVNQIPTWKRVWTPPPPLHLKASLDECQQQRGLRLAYLETVMPKFFKSLAC